MIDKNEFSQLRKQMEEYDAKRDMIIKEARDITKLSKQAIYSLHREDVAAAQEQLAAAERVVAKLLPTIQQDPSLRTGSFSSGLEEYTEAKAFVVFLREGRLITHAELQFVESEEYLLGLCDLTGELMRYAVMRATKRDRQAVERTRDIIDAVFGEFVQFDFRNSELRRKYDTIKYNLQKVENVLYDLALNARIASADES